MNLASLLIVFLIPSVAYAGKCPSGFTFYYSHGRPLGSPWPFQASCYKFVTDFETWVGARKKCKSLGAELVSVETVGEQNHLVAVIKAHSHLQRPDLGISGHPGYWTSGSDEQKEGQWKWTATGRSISYFNWIPGNPSNSGTQYLYENCLHLHSKFNYRWNDMYCFYPFMSYICEKKA